jgi:hypothetical protein
LGAVELWNLGSVIGLELDAVIDPYGHLWIVGDH